METLPLQERQLIKINILAHTQQIEIESVGGDYFGKLAFSTLSIDDNMLTVSFALNDMSYMRAIPVQADDQELWMVDYVC